MIEALQFTTEDWLVFASCYGAIMTLAVVVLWSLLDRARNDVKALEKTLSQRFPRRPEREDFDADRIHRIGGGK